MHFSFADPKWLAARKLQVNNAEICCGLEMIYRGYDLRSEVERDFHAIGGVFCKRLKQEINCWFAKSWPDRVSGGEERSNLKDCFLVILTANRCPPQGEISLLFYSIQNKACFSIICLFLTILSLVKEHLALLPPLHGAHTQRDLTLCCVLLPLLALSPP